MQSRTLVIFTGSKLLETWLHICQVVMTQWKRECWKNSIANFAPKVFGSRPRYNLLLDCTSHFFFFRSSNMSGSTPKRSPLIVSSVAKDFLSNATWKLILKLTKVLMSELSSVPNAITQQPLYHCWSCTCIHTLVSGHLFANCAVRAIKDLPTWGGIRRTCASWGRRLPWIREMMDLVVRLKRAGSTKQ